MDEALQIPVGLSPEIVSAIVGEMEARGLVVPKEGRLEPYSVAEVAEVSGLGRTTIERVISSGVLKRLQGTGRVMVSAASVKVWLEGGCER
jgi:excisionase family DNA binding protein